MPRSYIMQTIRVFVVATRAICFSSLVPASKTSGEIYSRPFLFKGSAFFISRPTYHPYLSSPPNDFSALKSLQTFFIVYYIYCVCLLLSLLDIFWRFVSFLIQRLFQYQYLNHLLKAKPSKKHLQALR